jgi:hypothetical protein
MNKKIINAFVFVSVLYLGISVFYFFGKTIENNILNEACCNSSVCESMVFYNITDNTCHLLYCEHLDRGNKECIYEGSELPPNKLSGFLLP